MVHRRRSAGLDFDSTHWRSAADSMARKREAPILLTNSRRPVATCIYMEAHGVSASWASCCAGTWMDTEGQ
jgi:hypothetical protein